MTSTPPANDDAPVAPDASRDADAVGELIAVVEEYDDAPDQCTIYPDGANRRLLTEWVSAGEGSFVSLDEMR